MGTIAYEIEHISITPSAWLRHAIESGRFRKPFSAEEQRALLLRLAQVEAFETYLRRAFIGQKQFSSRASTRSSRCWTSRSSLLPPEARTRSWSGSRIAAAQRARAHGRPLVRLDLARVRGRAHHRRPRVRSGGRNGRCQVPPRRLRNQADRLRRRPGDPRRQPEPPGGGRPRHRGPCAAEQTDRSRAGGIHDPSVALAILIHGDASFAARASSPETFNLHSVDGYSTGGTLHIIANNQIVYDRPSRGALDPLLRATSRKASTCQSSM